MTLFYWTYSMLLDLGNLFTVNFKSVYSLQVFLWSEQQTEFSKGIT